MCMLAHIQADLHPCKGIAILVQIMLSDSALYGFSFLGQFFSCEPGLGLFRGASRCDFFGTCWKRWAQGGRDL